MDTTLTVYGQVATTPRHVLIKDTHGHDISLLSFRALYYNRGGGEGNWITVTLLGKTASEAYRTFEKGDTFTAEGHLTIKDWESDTVSGTTVELEAYNFARVEK